MRNRTEQSRPGSVLGRSGAGAAFTLVELIVVMFIIGLLMALLVPTIGYIVRLGVTVGAQTRVDKLANAAEGYKLETGHYPGRRDTDRIGSKANPGEYTGSQILAACVFDYPYSDIGGNPGPDPASKYGGYEEGETLFTFDEGGDDERQQTLSDGFWGTPMAICYYVSWPGQTGRDQFHEADNSVYTAEHYATGQDFTTFITDPSYGLPYNDKTFLLISAGPDRKFFSDDDATNWKKAE